MPSFSLIEERSSNGNPLVQVSFADGSSDFLILNKYKGLDRHFTGYLYNEPTACVAMVSHPEHYELTIMSDRIVGSTQYKWKNNGNVELIPEVFSDGKETDVAMSLSHMHRSDETDVVYLHEKMKKLDEIEKHITPEQVASVPTKNKLQIQVTNSPVIDFNTYIICCNSLGCI